MLLLVMLLSIPACGRKKMSSSKDKTTKMTQRSDAFSRADMPLAEGDMEADEQTLSFFEQDLEEFAALGDQDDFELFSEEEEMDSSLAWMHEEENELSPLYFDYNKKQVRDDQQEKLAENIAAIKDELDAAKLEGTSAHVVVEGHTDSIYRSKQYNFAVSEGRAKEVANQLVAYGIEEDDIKTVGRGSQMLLREDGNKDDQWMNRRVEMHVVYS